ncbi:MAG: amino acid adenylation domain-containing protein, partial [Bacteroidota bacterium]
MASILGILRVGAAYLPIDTDYPEARKMYLLENSKASVLLTTQKMETDNLGIWTLLVEDASSEMVSKLPEIDPESLSYVIYTSGSTGQPKGVMLSHASLYNYLQWGSRYYLAGEKAVFPLYSSIAFDLTVTSIFLPLITGNSIVIYEGKEQALLIEEVIQSNKADIIKMTPSHLKLLIDGGLLPKASGKLKKIIVGGEELETTLGQQAYAALDGAVEIYNEYGPTEATVGCMIHRFNGQEKTASVPIGQPVDNTSVFVLDQYLKPVPEGVRGELYVAGAGLAKGYLNNETLTRERFIENPFQHGTRMYKTGDLACRLADGSLLYQERADDQVKIRGYRIELGEIENTIKSFEGIREAITVVSEKNNSKLLAAYFTADQEIDTASLKAYLSKHLPAYMLPTYFLAIDHIPLTVNGKVDRAALKAPEHALDTEVETASSLLEGVLVGIWADVLNIDKEVIGISSNFFELGGHSLLAMKLINQMSRNFEVSINLPDFFQDPTIKGVAHVIESGHKETEVLPELVADVENRYEPFPLTDVQQAYWIGRKDIYEFGGIGTHGYSEIFTPQLDIHRLTKVVNTMIDRHEMLRVIVTSDGEQRILENVPHFEVPVLDLNEHSEEEGKALFYERRSQMSHHVFSGE